MAHALTATTSLLRDRDLFIHDGRQLRRLRLSAPVQLLFLVLTVMLVGWSGYAAARLFVAEPAVVAQATPQSLTDQRARLIEQRQQVIAAMLAGEELDPALVAAVAEGAPSAALPAALQRVEREQALQAGLVADRIDAELRSASAAYRKLGLNPNRFTGVGGPFEPATRSDPTFKALFESWKKLDRLQDGAIAVPSDKPVKEAAFTSGYGVRSDPFQGRAAMHAGIDLSGPVGTPIHATADGVVLRSGWNSGGYGNLIEVDHGKGIQTRYAHLSSIAVREGQRVTRGQLIGRMGSTGRSTGSHLHYEVRIDGRAVNPIPFMKSTDYLVAIQRKGLGTPMDTVALGGPAKR